MKVNFSSPTAPEGRKEGGRKKLGSRIHSFKVKNLKNEGFSYVVIYYRLSTLTIWVLAMSGFVRG
jgi:hypothetical protein